MDGAISTLQGNDVRINTLTWIYFTIGAGF